MFSELLKNVEDQYKRNLPFVMYRKPKEELVQVIFQSDAKVHHVNSFKETGFVFAPFDSKEPSVLLVCSSKLSANYAPRNLETKREVSKSVDVDQKQFHIDLVKKGISQINQGTFKKVVLSRKVEIKNEKAPINLFLKLLDSYPTAFCYLWHHPKIGTWLGATPEILLKSENQNLTTMSLAGTQKYVENKNIKWGNKELEEQRLVTDYISKALQGSVSNLNIGERQSIRAGNLLHLRTKLAGRIGKGELANIIKVLHPTPAVCGMPMNTTKEFILKNENYNREYYTGFLGELNFKFEKDRASTSKNQENKAYRSVKNITTLFVNLRCMQLKESSAFLYVGGGVTQDSNAEKEWNETVAKSKTMLQVLSSD